MFRRLLHLFLFAALIAGCGGCVHRLKTRPVTPGIVQSRELCHEANTAMELGQWSEAEKRMERAVKLNPTEIDIRRHYAEVLWRQGKYRESLHQLDEATKIGATEGNEDETLSLSIAEKLLILGQIDEASRFAKRAIDIAPCGYKGWALHGKTERSRGEDQLQQGNTDQAHRYYQQAATDYYRALSLLGPESSETLEILSELAVLQTKMRQPQQALAIWQTLERQYRPNPQPILVTRGKAATLLEMGRIDEAANTYWAAIETTPDSVELYAELASLQLRCGRLNDARYTMDRIHRLAPNHSALVQLAEQMKFAQTNRRDGREIQ